MNKLAVANPGKVDIPLCRGPGFLYECVLHINGFLELGDRDQPVFVFGMDANFPDARTDARLGFPVLWVIPELYPEQFLAGDAARVRGKFPQVIT